jgi:quercetin dioxygenase-like cupin family protein
MNTSRKLTVAAVATVLVGGVYVSSAGATPPSTDPPEATGLVSGALDDSSRHMLRVVQDRVELKVKQPTSVATSTLTYEPGEFSGWHSHPGIVIAVVKSGTVTRQAGCETETFTAGQAFTEVGPHFVSNPGDVDAVLSITRIYPTSETVARHEEEPPVCP